jgi:hypothetical protein
MQEDNELINQNAPNKALIGCSATCTPANYVILNCLAIHSKSGRKAGRLGALRARFLSWF